MRWRWSNIPLPEVHLVSLVLGVVLHLFVPLSVFTSRWIGHALGWPVVVAGLALAGWAVWSIQDVDIEAPTAVIRSGPYALSRNPMYVGWTLISLGIALAVNTLWPLVFLPGVLLYTHFFVIRREERFLEQKFGDEYEAYRARVRRYL